MPYALFCQEARLSKAYPTEADVWERARQSGLLVDVASKDDETTPRPVFENDYEIRPCPPDLQQDLAENLAEVEWLAETDLGGDSGQVVLTKPSAAGRRSPAAGKRAVAMWILSGVKAGWQHGRHRDRI